MIFINADNELRAPPADKFRLNALVFHEDTRTRDHAKETLLCVAGQLGKRMVLNLELCDMKLLQDPLIRIQAALVARTTHLLMISVHSRRNWPVMFLTWLQEWRRSNINRPCALVLFLQTATGHLLWDYAMVSHMRKLAAELAVAFFYQLWTYPTTVPHSRRPNKTVNDCPTPMVYQSMSKAFAA